MKTIEELEEMSPDDLMDFLYDLMEEKCNVEGSDIDNQYIIDIIKRCALPDWKYPYDVSLLHWAIDFSNLEAAKVLLDIGVDIEIKDNNGKTPLHWAARNHDATLIEFLINNGANIEAKNNDGWTPLHYASFIETWDGFDSIRILLAAGANRSVVDDLGRTPWQTLRSGFDSYIPELAPNYNG